MELGIRLEGTHAERTGLLGLFAFAGIPALRSAISAGGARGGRDLTDMEAWAVEGSQRMGEEQ